jgi:site-specific DNA-methyltransferase (adenine-specific)
MLEVAPEMAKEFPDQSSAWKAYEDLEERAMTIAAKKNRPEEVVNAPKWAHDHFIVGDAIDGMSGRETASADFAEVDPPYAVEIDRRKGGRNIDKGHIGDYNEVDVKAYPPMMKAVIAQVHRLLKENTFAIFWHGTQWHCDMRSWLEQAGFAVNSTPAIWYKGAMGQTAQPDVMLASSYEPFFLARKGQPRMRRQGRSNVFHYSPLAPSKKVHSTEKPLDLMVDILDTMLFPGCNVLVPFLGSGVTLRAAYKLGHTGFGFDKSEAHKERFLQRVSEEYTELVS